MKKWVFILVSFFPVLLYAQPFSIQGTVTDASSRKSLPGAHVFINQSLKADRTDSSGQYSLKEIDDRTFEVVVSLAGYQTVTYRATPQKQLTTIKFELIPVSPVAGEDADGWRKWGRFFLNNFLGATPNGVESEVLNPEVLRFRYNDSTREISVEATDILQIINEGLGYMINYKLEVFKISPFESYLHSNGYFYFKNLTSTKGQVLLKWKHRRQEAFEGSLMHFMRAIWANNHQKEGFELHGLARVFEGDERYKSARKAKDVSIFGSGTANLNGATVKYIDLLDKKPLSIDSIRIVTTPGNNPILKYDRVIQVTYKNEKEHPNFLANTQEAKRVGGHQVSYLQLKQGVQVQPNGMFVEGDDIEVAGYMTWGKVGDLLPSEFRLVD